MKAMRRLTATIMGSMDWMVSQIENHEALVNAALREANEATARAKVQLARVRQDGEQMRKRLVDLREECDRWEQRARSTAMIDEGRALECLKRLKRGRSDNGILEQQERSHAALERQLSEDVRQLEDRLQKLRQQRNVMRTRESRAEALRAMQGHDSSLLGEIDAIFERWESKVTEYEVGATLHGTECDELARDFDEAESQRELKAELQKLIEMPRVSTQS